MAEEEDDLTHSAGEEASASLRKRRQTAAALEMEVVNRRTTTNNGQRVKSNRFSDAQQLAFDARVSQRATWTMLFVVFIDQINLLCVMANYPLMVTPDAHEDSFPSTGPFDPTSSQYAIIFCAQMGAFFSNLAAGWLSDKVGRRRVTMVNLIGGFVFTLAKYLVRDSFGLFLAFAFCNGMFASMTSVGLGYVGEVISDRVKVDLYMGYVIMAGVLGRSLGGLFPIFTPHDLFLPLLPVAVINILGLAVAWFYLLDPKEYKGLIGASESEQDLKDDEKEQKSESCTLFAIIFGSLMDNAGSKGIAPLALSPLMFNAFYLGPVQAGEDPPMTEQAYRWIFTLLALAAVPGALISPHVYGKIGIAMTSVVANLFTGGICLALLQIALLPQTSTTFGLFVTVLYVGFPLTVLSQLTAGPMLDRIATPDKKGFVQGLNGATYDLSGAIFPLLYALLIDAKGIKTGLYTCVGISAFAALINLPLVFHPVLQKQTRVEAEKIERESVVLTYLDEEEVAEKLERAEFVSLRDLAKVNVDRAARGEAPLIQHWGEYTSSENVTVSAEEYQFLRDLAQDHLELLNNRPVHIEELVAAVNSLRSNDQDTKQAMQEAGEWFANYLLDNGYHPGEDVSVLKHKFSKAFPKLSDRTVTVESYEARLLMIIHSLNDSIQGEGYEESKSWNFLGRGKLKTS